MRCPVLPDGPVLHNEWRGILHLIIVGSVAGEVLVNHGEKDGRADLGVVLGVVKSFADPAEAVIRLRPDWDGAHRDGKALWRKK